MAETKQLKGLQIGNSIYSQIDDTVEADPQLTWSGQKITQRAYLKEKQEGNSVTIISSNSGTVTIFNKNSNFLKLYANTLYSHTSGYTKVTNGQPSFSNDSSWITQPAGEYITIPSLDNEESKIYLYMNLWPKQAGSNYGATAFYNNSKTFIAAVQEPPESSEDNTVEIPEESSYFRFTYSKASYESNTDAITYIQFYIKDIPEESFITIAGLMPLTSYTIIVGDEGVISYNTDPIGEHFVEIENIIGTPSTEFENKTLWEVLEELQVRIATLESYHPTEEPETSETT